MPIEVPAFERTAAFGCRVEMPQIALWTGPAGALPRSRESAIKVANIGL
jgi:hypothetical protein